MPVAQGPRFSVGRVAGIALTIIALAIGALIVSNQLAQSGEVEIRLGDDEFNAGEAANQSAEIAENGPILYQALVGGVDLIVQHQGVRTDEGWLAFDARIPGRARECALRWIPEDELFVDGCDESMTIPADGEGLPQYPVEVDDSGDIIIDLRRNLVPTE